MTKVQIRLNIATDLPFFEAMDHSTTSEYVWQMDRLHEEGQIGAVFREIRLPRAVVVPYPRPIEKLTDEWSRRAGILVAVVEKEPVGYLRLSDKVIPQTAWIADLVVTSKLRRQGIGATLILAAQSWALDRGNHQAVLEMASKNCAAIRLAQKLGYEFCGYNDHYYLTQDIALFFGRALR